MTDTQIIYQVWELVQKHLGPNTQLFLFGSRSEGTNSDFSDFDFFVKSAILLTAEQWLNFTESVENLPTLYKIDLIDFNQAGDDFKKIASKSAKEILNGQVLR